MIQAGNLTEAMYKLQAKAGFIRESLTNEDQKDPDVRRKQMCRCDDIQELAIYATRELAKLKANIATKVGGR